MKRHKIAAALLACLTAAAQFAAISAYAEGETSDNVITSIPIKKYLVLDQDVRVPGTSFQFTLTSGSAVEGTETTSSVLAGPAGAVLVPSGDVSVSGNNATLTFSPDDAATPESSAPSGNTIAFATPDDTSDEKYIEKTVSIDISAVTFPEPGIYHYVFTEKPSSAPGIVNDAHPTRYVDIYVCKSVEHDEDVFVPEAAVIRTSAAAPTAEGKTDGSVKSDSFTNRYTTHALRFSKDVSGNQASFLQYFKFTVKLTGTQSPGEDSLYVTVGGTYDAQPAENMATAYDASDMVKANSTELTTDDAGGTFVSLALLRAGKIFYLHSGQTITLDGIPDGMGYQLTEAPEDYTPSVTLTGDDAAASGSSVTDTAMADDADAAFLNTRESVLPGTGIAAGIFLPAAVILAGIAGIAALLILRLRKKSHA